MNVKNINMARIIYSIQKIEVSGQNKYKATARTKLNCGLRLKEFGDWRNTEELARKNTDYILMQRIRDHVENCRGECIV
jgi:hypothetical protein